MTDEPEFIPGLTPASETRTVSVLVERRRGVTPWQDWVWQPVEVLEDAPAVPPWTPLRQAGDTTLFFAGTATLALHPTDTDNYRHNLAAEQPRLWVVLRHVEAAPGLAMHAATLDAGEAHLYADAGNDLLEALPLPPGLRAWLEDFTTRHHQPRGYFKRRRDRADPNALARRGEGE
jgi:hypothetical protein